MSLDLNNQKLEIRSDDKVRALTIAQLPKTILKFSLPRVGRVDYDVLEQELRDTLFSERQDEIYTAVPCGHEHEAAAYRSAIVQAAEASVATSVTPTAEEWLGAKLGALDALKVDAEAGITDAHKRTRATAQALADEEERERRHFANLERPVAIGRQVVRLRAAQASLILGDWVLLVATELAATDAIGRSDGTAWTLSIGIASIITAASAGTAWLLGRFGAPLVASRVGSIAALVGGTGLFVGVIVATSIVRAGGLIDPSVLGEDFAVLVPLAEIGLLGAFAIAFGVGMTVVEYQLGRAHQLLARVAPQHAAFESETARLREALSCAEAVELGLIERMRAPAAYRAAFEGALVLTRGKLIAVRHEIDAMTANGMSFLKWLNRLSTVDREEAIATVLTLVPGDETTGGAS